MKRNIKSMLVMLLGVVALAACSDNDYTELDKGSNILALTVNQAADTLSETAHAGEAVTLAWTTGHNFGTGRKIYYTLEIAPAGTDFANAYTAVDSTAQVYQWSINVEGLNDLVLDKMGATVGESVSLEARVTASVPDVSEKQTATVTFKATPYKAVTPTLYLIGDATPNGWSADNATPMTRTDNGIFTWEGDLKAGQLKFITTLGQFVPSYNKGADGNPILRSTFDEPDEQWSITEPHTYKITVNLLAGTIEMVQTEGVKPLYDELFFVGNATGWSFVKMTHDALDPYLFRYGRFFEAGKGGDFKFGTASGSWDNMYMAMEANAPISSSDARFVKGGTDTKWYLKDEECGKAYKICLDIRSGKEKMYMREFTPYPMVYLVGDATPAGWDIANATPMASTGSPYIFTWTGQLNAGELKFTCDRQADWMGAWFLCAAGNDAEPTGKAESMLFVDKSDNAFKAQYREINVGDIDQKWKITSSGTYTITLNQLEETITILKN